MADTDPVKLPELTEAKLRLGLAMESADAHGRTSRFALPKLLDAETAIDRLHDRLAERIRELEAELDAVRHERDLDHDAAISLTDEKNELEAERDALACRCDSMRQALVKARDQMVAAPTPAFTLEAFATIDAALTPPTKEPKNV